MSRDMFAKTHTPTYSRLFKEASHVPQKEFALIATAKLDDHFLVRATAFKSEHYPITVLGMPDATPGVRIVRNAGSA